MYHAATVLVDLDFWSTLFGHPFAMFTGSVLTTGTLFSCSLHTLWPYKLIRYCLLNITQTSSVKGGAHSSSCSFAVQCLLSLCVHTLYTSYFYGLHVHIIVNKAMLAKPSWSLYRIITIDSKTISFATHVGCHTTAPHCPAGLKGFGRHFEKVSPLLWTVRGSWDLALQV